MVFSAASRNIMDVGTADDLKNPFEVTKATDFDDRQIASNWVDFPGGGFRSVIDPRSPVAKFILGGKGSGRTHLMRYYSSGLQAIRFAEGALKSFADEGYVGVYISCSGLNAGRFAGKAQSDDTWGAVFSYYFDLWVASRILMAVDELWISSGSTGSSAHKINIVNLFDTPSASLMGDGSVAYLRELLREVDVGVNEAAITRDLRVSIRSSPSRLPFGVIDELGRVDVFRDLQFALLIDEFEYLSETQQRYINTLIREKRPKVGFLVGARTAGVKTLATLGGEINREGSEFETIVLDTLHLKNSAGYRQFCRLLVARRLVQAGFFTGGDEGVVVQALDSYFFEPPRTPLGQHETTFVTDQSAEGRKSLQRLRKQLLDYRSESMSEQDIERIIGLLHLPSSPLIEKLAVYLFYRAWNQQEPLLEAANRIHNEEHEFIAGGRHSSFAEAMGHFRNDMLAQLLNEYRQKQRYLGFSEFIELSGGLPRGLLVVLKHVFRWAVFNGESPFAAGHAITAESQRTGVREASAWFFQDLPGIGSNGIAAQRATERLGNFLKRLRFSDKPVESSLCTISINSTGLSDTSKAVIDHCVEFSFLLRITSGHKDRNTRMRKQKLQLHPMLCPIWDLPTSRRGVLELSADESNAIFDDRHAEQLVPITRIRLRRMTAPFRISDSSDGTLFLS